MTRNQDIRAEILLQLYAARPVALSAAAMARNSRKAGLDYTEADYNRELPVLVGSGHVGSGELPTGEDRFFLTGKGVLDHERGL